MKKCKNCGKVLTYLHNSPTKYAHVHSDNIRCDGFTMMEYGFKYASKAEPDYFKDYLQQIELNNTSKFIFQFLLSSH